MSSSGKTSGLVSVLAALGGNAFITVIKFLGFFISGSGALFSEAVHSFADTMNQTLLLVGIRRSSKKADNDFSYGYGQERFFWALISACGIFFIGAGVTIYHGITSLLSPDHKVEFSPVIFVILAISLIVESFTFATAIREKRRRKNENDTTIMAVIYEDGVALLGIFIAFVSIYLTKVTGNYYWDALGSIIIGVLLGVVAIFLMAINRGYLIEKSISENMKKKIIKILEKDPAIEKVLDFKSSTLDVGSYRIKCEVEFNGHALLKEINKTVDLRGEYNQMKNSYEEFVRFYSEQVDRIPRLIGKHIDVLEQKIIKEVPGIRHIDIEIN